MRRSVAYYIIGIYTHSDLVPEIQRINKEGLKIISLTCNNPEWGHYKILIEGEVPNT